MVDRGVDDDDDEEEDAVGLRSSMIQSTNSQPIESRWDEQ